MDVWVEAGAVDDQVECGRANAELIGVAHRCVEVGASVSVPLLGDDVGGDGGALAGSHVGELVQ